ncbi:hypothetical protein ACIA6C_27445 [Streptomyces sp. NPDC051578]|uniref:hypothetical protein n=1 Tax=Streptomyces sp. NPDC051578 TaxID=3365662 RepID=UPI003791AF5C
MTNANHAEIFLRSAGGLGLGASASTTRAGEWTYTSWTPDKGATLRSQRHEVDLHYSSSIFEDFLEAMNRIQNEFSRRSPHTDPAQTAVSECSGETPRV